MMQYKIYYQNRMHYFSDFFRAKWYADKIEKRSGKRLQVNKTYKLINKIKWKT